MSDSTFITILIHMYFSYHIESNRLDPLMEEQSTLHSDINV